MPDHTPQALPPRIGPDPKLPELGLVALNQLLASAGAERSNIEHLHYLRKLERVLETEFTLGQLHWLFNDVFNHDFIRRTAYLAQKGRDYLLHPAGGVYIFFDDKGAWRYDWIDPILLDNHITPGILVMHAASSLLAHHLVDLSFSDGKPYTPRPDLSNGNWLRYNRATLLKH